MAKRTLNNLTDTVIKQATESGRMADGGGLYLVVSDAGTKAWVFMWVKDKKRSEMGLGAYPAITLKAARKRAAACRTLVAEGKNPIEEKKKDKKVLFRDAAEAYLKSKEGSWRNDKHRYQWRQTLGLDDGDVQRRVIYCANLIGKPVSGITTEDVLEALTPIWQTRSETASRVRGRIELVLDFAKAKEWRTGDNPARWKGHLRNVLPAPRKGAKAHLAAMPYKDLPPFVEALRSREAMAARALEFLILTAARTSEVIKATWAEIDMENVVWTVPAERMKGGEEHVVPLSKAALAILMPLNENRVSKYVFPGNVTVKTSKKKDGVPPLSNMACEMLLRRMGVDNATVHGFRSSFRDWAGDTTDCPREVTEAALAHKIGNAVERAYRRGTALEKRRRLMEQWADYCSNTIPAAIVVQFKA